MPTLVGNNHWVINCDKIFLTTFQFDNFSSYSNSQQLDRGVLSEPLIAPVSRLFKSKKNIKK